MLLQLRPFFFFSWWNLYYTCIILSLFSIITVLLFLVSVSVCYMLNELFKTAFQFTDVSRFHFILSIEDLSCPIFNSSNFTFHSVFSIWLLSYLPTLILLSLLCFIISCSLYENFLTYHLRHTYERVSSTLFY